METVESRPCLERFLGPSCHMTLYRPIIHFKTFHISEVSTLGELRSTLSLEHTINFLCDLRTKLHNRTASIDPHYILVTLLQRNHGWPRSKAAA